VGVGIRELAVPRRDHLDRTRPVHAEEGVVPSTPRAASGAYGVEIWYVTSVSSART